MKFRKIFLPLLCAIMLCSCTKTNDNTATTNTTSNKTTTSSTSLEGGQMVNNAESFSTQKVVWGFGKIENHAQPQEPKTLQDQFESLGANWLLKNEKSICLTFDEGYENGYTPAILDTLKKKKVKAIFFVTYDFAKDNPSLIKRMIDEGHIVGNHTYRHYTMDEVSESVATEEVMYLHKYIKENYNYTMSYFRFPKGEFSPNVLNLVNKLGYKSVFWSFAYADWDENQQPEPTKAKENIVNSTHPGEILLLHAVSKTNSEILGDVIDEIKKQGYSFTTKI